MNCTSFSTADMLLLMCNDKDARAVWYLFELCLWEMLLQLICCQIYFTAVPCISCFLCALIHGILIFIGLLLLAFIPLNTSMLAGAGLLGLCYSVAIVGTVMLCKTMFGIENYSSVYPKISMGTTLANAAGASIIGYLYDFTGSYLIALYLIMAMVAVSMIIIAKCYQRKTAR